MSSISPLESSLLRSAATSATVCAVYHHQLPCFLSSHQSSRLSSNSRCLYTTVHLFSSRKSLSVVASATLMANSLPPRNGVYTVGDFMTRKEDLCVVNQTTSVDEALETLVENRITGFPVIDDDWKLVGLVSDYDLLALDSISGTGRSDTNMFPEADSTWKDEMLATAPKARAFSESANQTTQQSMRHSSIVT